MRRGKSPNRHFAVILCAVCGPVRFAKSGKISSPCPLFPENGKWFVEGVRRLDERQLLELLETDPEGGMALLQSQYGEPVRYAAAQRPRLHRGCAVSACTTPSPTFTCTASGLIPKRGSLRAYLTAIAERKAIRRWRGKPPQADGGAALRAGISLSHRMGNARRAPRFARGSAGIGSEHPSAPVYRRTLHP